MIFGGAFMAQLDLCAAACVTRFLHDSECDSAVTYRINNLVFHGAAMIGDIVFMYAKITQVRTHAIVVNIEAFREKRDGPKRDKVADAEFVFVSRKGDKVHPHGMKL
jgi:acyl-CoA hydrolase